ncbi:MAG: hypothetical protein EZS28_046544, partial [Streblomastix strix]
MALKEVNYETEEEIQKIDKEITVMRDVVKLLRQQTQQSQFLHVVEPLGFFLNEEGNKAFIVMEYCAGGDLRHYIKNLMKMRADIKDKLAWEIIGQLASAIFQLHTNGIIHGDIKPENILFTEDLKVKL